MWRFICLLICLAFNTEGTQFSCPHGRAPPIYYKHLSRRTDRMEALRQGLPKDLFEHAEFLDTVDGQTFANLTGDELATRLKADFGVTQFPNWKVPHDDKLFHHIPQSSRGSAIKYYGRDLHPGEIAIMISFLRALRKIADGEAGWGFVLDDDYFFRSSETFCQMALELDRLMSNGHQWNAVYLFVGPGATTIPVDEFDPISPAFSKVVKSMGIYALAISKQYAQWLLDLDVTRCIMPGDDFLTFSYAPHLHPRGAHFRKCFPSVQDGHLGGIYAWEGHVLMADTAAKSDIASGTSKVKCGSHDHCFHGQACVSGQPGLVCESCIRCCMLKNGFDGLCGTCDCSQQAIEDAVQQQQSEIAKANNFYKGSDSNVTMLTPGNFVAATRVLPMFVGVFMGPQCRACVRLKPYFERLSEDPSVRLGLMISANPGHFFRENCLEGGEMLKLVNSYPSFFILQETSPKLRVVKYFGPRTSGDLQAFVCLRLGSCVHYNMLPWWERVAFMSYHVVVAFLVAILTGIGETPTDNGGVLGDGGNIAVAGIVLGVVVCIAVSLTCKCKFGRRHIQKKNE